MTPITPSCSGRTSVAAPTRCLPSPPSTRQRFPFPFPFLPSTVRMRFVTYLTRRGVQTHFILKHQNPVTKEIEEKVRDSPALPVRYVTCTHCVSHREGRPYTATPPGKIPHIHAVRTSQGGVSVCLCVCVSVCLCVCVSVYHIAREQRPALHCQVRTCRPPTPEPELCPP